jgi:hypothetical protein
VHPISGNAVEFDWNFPDEAKHIAKINWFKAAHLNHDRRVALIFVQQFFEFWKRANNEKVRMVCDRMSIRQDSPTPFFVFAGVQVFVELMF